MRKTKSEILVQEKDKEYAFDDAALRYASMSDEEAEQHKANLKARIKNIENSATFGQDPVKIDELRELKSSLAWIRANKHRSKYFKVVTSGPSMRRAKRHPETNWLKSKDGNTSTRRKSKNRHTRKEVQISKSIFSKLFGKKSEDKLSSSPAI